MIDLRWLSRFSTMFIASVILTVTMGIPSVTGQESNERGRNEEQQAGEAIRRRVRDPEIRRDVNVREEQGAPDERVIRALREKLQMLRREGRNDEAEAIERAFRLQRQAEREFAAERPRNDAPDRMRAAEGPDERMEHLKQAIEHLRAAGMEDLAAHVKQQGGRMLQGMPAPGPDRQYMPGAPPMPQPQMERIGRAMQQVQEAIGNVERRVQESEQLGRALDEAHRRIDELSRMAENQARELDQSVGDRLQELERQFSRRMEEMERGLGQFVERTQQELNERLERFMQEQEQARREREQMERREREEMEQREREEIERREQEEREAIRHREQEQHEDEEE